MNAWNYALACPPSFALAGLCIYICYSFIRILLCSANIDVLCVSRDYITAHQCSSHGSLIWWFQRYHVHLGITVWDQGRVLDALEWLPSWTLHHDRMNSIVAGRSSHGYRSPTVCLPSIGLARPATTLPAEMELGITSNQTCFYQKWVNDYNHMMKIIDDIKCVKVDLTVAKTVDKDAID